MWPLLAGLVALPVVRVEWGWLSQPAGTITGWAVVNVLVYPLIQVTSIGLHEGERRHSVHHSLVYPQFIGDAVSNVVNPCTRPSRSRTTHCESGDREFKALTLDSSRPPVLLQIWPDNNAVCRRFQPSVCTLAHPEIRIPPRRNAPGGRGHQ